MPYYQLITSTKFLKDLKLLKKRSQKDFALLQELISVLVEHGHSGLAPKHRPHKLKGNYSGYWECHVKPDLLLIWDENEEIRLLELVRTGTHSDLFG
ncbi:type II toxin-antitoxin system YafQ family toxin [Parapedobacter koreensis]|uniref:mRNA interferase YafQ n=1 Tax=Parapedobacter koreensis TaxID=332977 RepID=A0A1H7U9T6_9SPHI|nr:type II toxin-antitoxin system YafQ family toxin [Parapedobacter koreensis]SEL93524.1 mRNA interferase YafQ [Parapedobacter koreensis]